MNITVVVIFLLFILAGCAPYVGYTHLSDPRIGDDGYDLVCGGLKADKTVELSAAVCKNLHGGEYIKFDIEYIWKTELR